MTSEHHNSPSLPRPPTVVPEVREAAFARALQRHDAKHGRARHRPTHRSAWLHRSGRGGLRYAIAAAAVVIVALPTAWLYLDNRAAREPQFMNASAPTRERQTLPHATPPAAAPPADVREQIAPRQSMSAAPPAARPADRAALAETDRDRCFGSEPGSKIIACTRLIQDPARSASERSVGYAERGLAYHRNGELDRAAADFDEAIRLDSRNAAAFYNRNLLRAARGDVQGASADRARAIAIDPSYGSRR